MRTFSTVFFLALTSCGLLPSTTGLTPDGGSSACNVGNPMTATIDGTAFAVCATDTLNSAVLRITGYDSKTRHEINIAIPNPPHTGTYSLAATQTATYGQYVTYDYGNTSATYATISTTPGTLTLTSYDATTQKASGTFSFTAYLANTVSGAPQSVTVTGGSFTAVAGP